MFKTQGMYAMYEFTDYTRGTGHVCNAQKYGLQKGDGLNMLKGGTAYNMSKQMFSQYELSQRMKSFAVFTIRIRQTNEIICRCGLLLGPQAFANVQGTPDTTSLMS